MSIINLQSILYFGQAAAISYTFMMLSFISSIWGKGLIWGIFFLIYLLLGFTSNRITIIGLAFIFIFILQVYYFSKLRKGVKKYFLGLGIFVWSVLAKLHLLSGFNNWKIISGVKLSEDSIPYNLYINFDTPIIGIMLSAMLLPRFNKNLSLLKILSQSKYILILSILVITSFSVLLGFVKPDFKYPDFFVVWLMLNIITVVTEEIFYRGWLLNLFMDIFSRWVSIIIVSIIFGLLHFYGGALYVFLAIISSVFYSYIYVRTSSILSSILLHLLINIIHILFFTYPALA